MQTTMSPIDPRTHDELPPTAGLPARLRDFLPPWRGGFAAQAAAWLDTDWALLTCSGTAALWIALDALKTLAPERHSVVIPAYTCPLVAEAVLRAGLRPRLCDTAPGHFDLDTQALAGLCDADTLAVLPTHMGGRVVDVGAAQTIAARVGAFVIEDAAQAFGARAPTSTGALASVGLRGDVGFFSYSVGKGLTLYEGGLLIARDARVRAALELSERRLVHGGAGWNLRRAIELLGYALLYRPRTLGLVYGAPLRRALDRDDVIAAVGDRPRHDIPLHRVGRLRQSVGRRELARYRAHLAVGHAHAAARAAALAALPGVRVMRDMPGAIGVWPYLLLELPDVATRDAALRLLWRRGLGVTRLFAHALPDYPQLRGRIESAALPHARAFAARTLTLGNSAWLDDMRFEIVRTTLQGVLAQTGCAQRDCHGAASAGHGTPAASASPSQASAESDGGR